MNASSIPLKSLSNKNPETVDQSGFSKIHFAACNAKILTVYAEGQQATQSKSDIAHTILVSFHYKPTTYRGMQIWKNAFIQSDVTEQLNKD